MNFSFQLRSAYSFPRITGLKLAPKEAAALAIALAVSIVVIVLLVNIPNESTSSGKKNSKKRSMVSRQYEPDVNSKNTQYESCFGTNSIQWQYDNTQYQYNAQASCNVKSDPIFHTDKAQPDSSKEAVKPPVCIVSNNIKCKSNTTVSNNGKCKPDTTVAPQSSDKAKDTSKKPTSPPQSTPATTPARNSSPAAKVRSLERKAQDDTQKSIMKDESSKRPNHLNIIDQLGESIKPSLIKGLKNAKAPAQEASQAQKDVEVESDTTTSDSSSSEVEEIKTFDSDASFKSELIGILSSFNLPTEGVITKSLGNNEVPANETLKAIFDALTFQQKLAFFKQYVKLCGSDVALGVRHVRNSLSFLNYLKIVNIDIEETIKKLDLNIQDMTKYQKDLFNVSSFQKLLRALIANNEDVFVMKPVIDELSTAVYFFVDAIGNENCNEAQSVDRLYAMMKIYSLLASDVLAAPLLASEFSLDSIPFIKAYIALRKEVQSGNQELFDSIRENFNLVGVDCSVLESLFKAVPHFKSEDDADLLIREVCAGATSPLSNEESERLSIVLASLSADDVKGLFKAIPKNSKLSLLYTMNRAATSFNLKLGELVNAVGDEPDLQNLTSAQAYLQSCKAHGITETSIKDFLNAAMELAQAEKKCMESGIVGIIPSQISSQVVKQLVSDL